MGTYREFEVLFPSSVGEAVLDLDRLGDQALLLAGGVEVLMLISAGVISPEYLIDINVIPELAVLDWDGAALHIGATTTHEQLARNSRVQEQLPMLAQAEAAVGTVRIRNQGTLVGNVCMKYSHSDPLPALLAYEAYLVVLDHRGEHKLPIEEFLSTEEPRVEDHDLLRDTSETILNRHAVVTRVVITPLPRSWGQAYERSERLFRPINQNVSVAGHLVRGTIDEIRIAVGCIGSRARRLRDVEAELQGATIDQAQRFISEHVNDLCDSLSLRNDFLGSADYKAFLLGVLLTRALEGIARSEGQDG